MKKIIRTVIIAVICVSIILGYYFYLSVRSKKSALDGEDQRSNIEKVLDTNLDLNYPSTPREVVKLFNEVLYCYYNEAPGEDDVYNLAMLQYELLDKDLQDNNPEMTYIQSVRNDVKDFNDRESTIQSATVCGTNEVLYKTVEGRECAYVSCKYFIKTGKEFEYSTQMYVLRRDDDNRWKILVYYLVEE